MTTLTAPALPLADIHLHTVPSYWPLAWGWWAVITVSLIVIITVGYQLHRRNQHIVAKKEAIAILKSYHFEGGLTAINVLLKQAALSYFPRSIIAPLTGTQWLLFLDQQLPLKYRGFIDQQSSWQQGLFSSIPLTEPQFNDCQQQALLWLQYALPAKTISHDNHECVITKESSNV
ncbi:DUF4381 domain-containing protein [Photobacterium carnosum]|uniref:DUF4381 domain-containing protein n=1 Tax=Photobacterium carnosum TaxID=2023717 RepID=UPI001E54CC62|nr:DUF4381 domain-containing protein [Photobacterium carnosum]MCD9529710.1 DUF4381 family protein [Photobacterium carnosum]MCD9545342.1 DUF4381 family protein [Photobacterium carnosum]MCD9550267.1 DUF4381 family protein [Photobacterium carnosum]MCF2155286.1 DUF4381 family protein [Photobacterium carnosum]MCF2217156.1 DUF4381 family protein [Photobacterium carnosum]